MSTLTKVNPPLRAALAGAGVSVWRAWTVSPRAGSRQARQPDGVA